MSNFEIAALGELHQVMECWKCINWNLTLKTDQVTPLLHLHEFIYQAQLAQKTNITDNKRMTTSPKSLCSKLVWFCITWPDIFDGLRVGWHNLASGHKVGAKFFENKDGRLSLHRMCPVCCYLSYSLRHTQMCGDLYC